MALELTGKIVEISPTVQVTDRFKKRDFVLDITEEVNGQSYPNFAKMQAAQNRCEALDGFVPGDMVKVSFNVRGNKWEKDGKVNYITNLDAWRIEAAAQQSAPATTWDQRPAQGTPVPTQSATPAGNAAPADDLPF